MFKKIFNVLWLSLFLAACSLPNPFRPSPMKAEMMAIEAQIKARDLEMRKSLPSSFSINFHDFTRYTVPVSYDENCLNTAPYLAEDGDSAFVGMSFDSQLLETTIVSETEAVSKFLLTLSTVNIENHVVNIKDQTVKFDGEEESALVLDPQIWIDKANEINSMVAPTTIFITYIANPRFNQDVDFMDAKPYEQFFWISSSATCNNLP